MSEEDNNIQFTFECNLSEPIEKYRWYKYTVLFGKDGDTLLFSDPEIVKWKKFDEENTDNPGYSVFTSDGWKSD